MSGRVAGIVVVTLTMLTSVAGRARPDDPGSDLFTFDVGDDIETFDSANFRVHFTRAGTHAVPLADVDDNGVPDHVEALLAIYETAHDHYLAMGFRVPVSDDGLPDNGGDGRFDVYLVDFARNADGAYRSERCAGAICAGYMVQENDFAGYGYPSVVVANRTVASHELFHAVQAAYDADQGGVVAEGTAVWASERFDASLRDLEGFAYGYLDNASTPLDSGRGGPVDSFTYGAGIFFEYLSERFDDDVVLHLWEGVADDVDGGADWFEVIDDVLVERGSSFVAAFAEFSTWTLFTGDRADPPRSFENGAQMVERSGTDKTLPVVEAGFTVFTASSRLLQLPTNDADTLRLQVVADAAGLDGLFVYALPLAIDGSALDLVDATAGMTDGIDLDVRAASDLFVLVGNARQDGGSTRPRLCIGSTDDVEACVVAEGEGEGEEEPAGDEPAAGCTSSRSSVSSSTSSSLSSTALALPAALLPLLARR
ncbi:MAG TPA: MXAN_6640 family putative metalloprotease, partial [Myxococcota bacterium]